MDSQKSRAHLEIITTIALKRLTGRLPSFPIFAEQVTCRSIFERLICWRHTAKELGSCPQISFVITFLSGKLCEFNSDQSNAMQCCNDKTCQHMSCWFTRNSVVWLRAACLHLSGAQLVHFDPAPCNSHRINIHIPGSNTCKQWMLECFSDLSPQNVPWFLLMPAF